MPNAEGWHGWDAYAAFYDWENARTVGRRDVRFWRDFAVRVGGRVLELGCGTGRISVPLARAGIPLVGIDRSAEMLAYARRRVRRSRLLHPPALVRGDIRHLPFSGRGTFDLVLAPYGILQSLLRDRDLGATLAAVAGVLPAGGRFGIDLVPDVPKWKEYRRRVSLTGRRGRSGPAITLVESVRQDRARRFTIFDHEYVEGWGPGRRVHRFSVTFRTLAVPAMLRRIERAGFAVDAVLGDYQGRPFSEDADSWIVLATRT
jgi:SAM-dependent methyltransferase